MGNANDSDKSASETSADDTQAVADTTRQPGKARRWSIEVFEREQLSFEHIEVFSGSFDEADMMALLVDGRTIVRANALRALAVVGAHPSGMVPLLRDSDPIVATAAADALERLGPQMAEAAPAITQALDGARESVREQVLDALAALVGVADDALIEALDVAPERVQDAAVEALVRAGRPGALVLARALAEGKTLVRYNSARGLQKLAEAGVFSKLGPDPRVIQALSRARDHDDASDVREAADDALSAIMAIDQVQAAIRANRAAAEAAKIPIPGFVDRPLSVKELAGKVPEEHKPRVVMALQDGRELVRANAARVLAALGEDKAADTVRPISVLLRDSHPPVREAAARSLGFFGKASVDVVDVLVTALGDPDARVVRAASDGLRSLGEDARAALVRGLDIDNRLHALGIIELVHALSEPAACLARAFSSPAVNVQVNAALGLGLLGPKHVGAGRRVLEAARTGGDARTRQAVFEALIMLEPPREAGPPPIDVPGFQQRLLPPEDIDVAGISVPSAVDALRDGRSVVRANAATTLAKMGRTQAAGAARFLSVLVRDSAPEVRVAAVRSLGSLGEDAGDWAHALVSALGDRQSAVVTAAKEAVAAVGRAALPALMRGLESVDRAHVNRVIESIHQRPDAVNALCSGLDATSPIARQNAALGLGILGPGKAGDSEPALRRAMAASEGQTRVVMRQALAMLAPPRDEGPPPIAIAGFHDSVLTAQALHAADIPLASLMAASSDPRTVVRINTATACRGPGLPSQEAARALDVLTRDAEGAVREAAIRSLGVLSEREPTTRIHSIVRALGDREQRVVSAAAEVLRNQGNRAASALTAGLSTAVRAHARQVLTLLLELSDAPTILAQAFLSPRVDVQVNAALGLGLLGAKRVGTGRDVLETARTSGDARTRAAVREALSLLEEPGDEGPAPGDLLRAGIAGFGDQFLSPEDIDASAFTAAVLAGALSDGHAVARANAATALSTVGEQALPYARLLVVLLRDSSPRVGLAAVNALSKLGRAVGEFIPGIARAGGDAHPRVAEPIVEMLVGLVGKTDDDLVNALDVSPEFGQDIVVEALMRAGRPGALLLSRALTQERTLVRFNAAQGVKRLARSGALEGLGVDEKIIESLSLVRDTDGASDVRTTAAAAIAAVVAARQSLAAERAARTALEASKIAIAGFAERVLTVEECKGQVSDVAQAKPRLVLALQDGREVVRANAARALAALGQTHAGDQVRAISVLLRDAAVSVRRAAADALVGLGAASLEVADGMVEALGDPDKPVRETISSGLRALGASVAPVLVRGLDTVNRWQATEVIALIHELDDPVDVLSRQFLHPAVAVQVNAALGLGRLGAERVGVGRTILEAARTGGDARTRTAVHEALAMLHVPGEPAPVAIDIPGFGTRTMSAKELADAKLEVTALVQSLSDGRPMARCNAAAALAARGDAAVPYARLLVVLLRDSDAAVGLAAARALQALGVSVKEMIPAMAQALDGVDARVRAQALDALVGLVGEADESLVDALNVSPDSRGQDVVVEALVRAGSPGALVLVAALREPRTLVRYNSARGIQRVAANGRLTGLGVDEKLLQALDEVRSTDEASDVRATADDAISAIVASRYEHAAMLAYRAARDAANIAIPGFAERPLSSADLNSVPTDDKARVVLSLQDGRPLVRANATRVLAALGAESAGDTVRAIAVLLRDVQPDVRRAAAQALAKLGRASLEVSDHLVAALGDDSEPVVLAADDAIRGLGAAMRDALMRGLDTGARAHALRVLAAIHRLDDAEATLCQAFSSASENIQVNAALGLGLLGRDAVGVGKTVLEAARTGGHKATRDAVRDALAMLAPPPPPGPKPIEIPGFSARVLAAGDIDLKGVERASVMAALGDGRAPVRANAATCLAKLGPGEPGSGMQGLSVLMRDSEHVVRVAAARALGQLGQSAASAGDVLVRALGDVHREVVNAARAALAALGDAATPALLRGLNTDDSAHADAILDLLLAHPDAANVLADGFSSGTERVQINAARGLGRLGPERIGTGKAMLEAARASASAPVRRAVRAALSMVQVADEDGPPPVEIDGFGERPLTAAEMALSKVAPASLVAALGDGRPAARANALTALGSLGERGAPHALLMAVMLRDSEPTVAMAAARALRALGPAISTHVTPIARAWHGTSEPVREQIIELFVGFVGQADDALVTGLDVSPEHGPDAIVEAMVRAGRPGALLLVRALTEDKTLKRYNSARGVERLARRGGLSGDGVDVEILRALGRVRDTDEATDVRTAAGAAIAAIKAAQLSVRLARAERLARDAANISIPEFVERGLTFDELGTRVSAEQLDKLVLALQDGDAIVRANAARALAVLGAKRAGHAVISISVLLRDTERSVQAAAASALARFGEHAVDAANALVYALSVDDPAVYGPAHDVLQAMGARARPALIDGLRTDSRSHGIRIVECINALPDAKETLCAAFSSLLVDVQVNAARGLGLLGRERVGDGRYVLEAARTGGHRRTREAVREALEQLAPPPPPGPPAIEVAGFDERLLTADEIRADENAQGLTQASLSASMTDARPVVRANAATAMATAANLHDDGVHWLAVLLRDSDAHVRTAAARALGAFDLTAESTRAPDSPRDPLDALVRALGDSVESVCRASADALISVGDPAMPALIRGLETDSRTHARWINQVILQSPRAVAELTAAFRGPKVGVQVNAALGLGMLGPDNIGRGREALEAARTGGDGRTRAAVREALEMVTPPPEPGPPPIDIPGFSERVFDQKQLDTAAKASDIEIASVLDALSDGRSTVRANAALLLGALGERGHSHAHELALLVRDSAASVRRACALALGQMGAAAIAQADALVLVVGDSDEDVSRVARDALARLSQDALPALVRGLQTDDPRVAYGVIGLIHQLDDPVTILCDAFASPSVDVQINAALGLGLLGADKVGEGRSVLEVARTGGDGRTRAAVRDALAMLSPPPDDEPAPIEIPGFYERVLDKQAFAGASGPAMLASLEHALEDGREIVRANAVIGLGVVHGDELVIPISVLLRDSSVEVRLAAARALGMLGVAAIEVAGALATAVGDADRDVADAASAALRSLGDRVAPALVRALDTDSEAHASGLLALIEPLDGAADMLFEAFFQPALQVQINAAIGLGMLGRKRVGEPRLDTLDDEQWHGDLRKRRAVRRALIALSE